MKGSARGARRLLSILGPVYGLATAARNQLYDRGLRGQIRVACPVVSVGNLTVGGTGKTPIACEIARRLLHAGEKPAILLRGYGARGDGAPVPAWMDQVPEDGLERWGDEALAHARRLPDALVFALPDRAAAARKARELGASVIVLDDGFQHRRLVRDLDIVCLDWTRPFGSGGLLPGGDLRERVDGLRRAHLIMRTRWSEDAQPSADEGRVRAWTAGRPSIRWAFRPGELRRAGGNEAATGRRAVAAAGIADPRSFARTAAEAGLDVVAREGFGDHHRYCAKDLRRLREVLGRCGADLIVTTEKDEPRLLALPEGSELARRGLLGVLELRLEPHDPCAPLDEALARLSPRPSDPRSSRSSP